jgi:hypothetical protein
MDIPEKLATWGHKTRKNKFCIFFITDEDMSENQNEMEIFKVQQHSDNELLSR